MMLELELNLGRKGRIWLDEALPVIFSPQEIYEETVDIRKSANVACGNDPCTAF